MAIDIPLQVSLSVEEGKSQIDAIVKGGIDKLRREFAKGVDVDLRLKVGVEGAEKVKSASQAIDQLARSQKKVQNTTKSSNQQLTVSAAMYRKLYNEKLKEIDATNILDKSYGRLKRELKTLQVLLDEQMGIQKGSIVTLKREAAELRQNSENLNLNAYARRQLNEAIVRNSSEQRRASGVMKGSLNDLRAYAADIRRLRDNEVAGSIAHQKYARDLSKIEAEINKLKPKTTGLFTVFARFAILQAAFTGVSAAFRSIGNSINYVVTRQKQVEGFKLSLQGFGFSVAETNRRFAQAAILANKLGAPLQQVEQTYKRMSPVLQAVGVSAADADNFIKNVSARTQLLGLNGEQSGRLLEAFAQALSKGKLQAEELNQQISELDGAFRTQLADALGVSGAELTELVKTGQITAPVLVKAVNEMENGVSALEERIRSGNATIQQLQNFIGNLNTKNLEALGAAFDPAIRALLRLQLEFTKFINTLINSQFGQFIAATFNQAVVAVTGFLSVLTKLTGAILELTEPFFAVLNVVNGLLAPVGGLGAALVILAARFIAVKIAAALASKELVIFGQKLALNGLAQSAGKSLRVLGIAINQFGKGNKAEGVRALNLAFKGLRGQLSGAGSAASRIGSSFLKVLTQFRGLAVIAGRLGGVLVKFVSGPVGLIITAVTVLTSILKPAFQAFGLFGKQVSTAEGSLKKLGIATTDPISGIKNLIVQIFKIGTPIGWLIGLFQQLIKFFRFLAEKWRQLQTFFKDKAIQTQISRLNGLADDAAVKFAKYGNILGELNKVQAMNKEEAKEASAAMYVLKDAYEESINAIEAEIQAEKDSISTNDARIKLLENEKAKLQDRVKVLDKNIEKVGKHAVSLGVTNKELNTSANKYAKAKAALEKFNNELDASQAREQAKAIDEYNGGLLTTEQLTVKLAAIEAAAAAEKKKRTDAALEAGRQELEEFKGNAADRQKKEEELAKIAEEAADADKDRADKARALSDAIIDGIKSQVTELQGFADKANEVANQIQSSINEVGSSASSAISAFSSLADVQAEIAVEQGADPKKVAQEVLAIKLEGIKADKAINAANIIAAGQAKKIELEIQKIRLETEANVLAAQGKTQAAARLRSLIPVLDNIGGLIDINTQNQLAANEASSTAAELGALKAAKEKGVNVEYGNQLTALENTKLQQRGLISNTQEVIGRVSQSVTEMQKVAIKTNEAATNVQGLKTGLETVASTTRSQVTQGFNDAGTAANQIGTQLQTGLSNAAAEVPRVTEATRVESEKQKGYWTQVAEGADAAGQIAADAIKNKVSDGFSSVKEQASELTSELKGRFSGIGDLFSNPLATLSQAFSNFVQNLAKRASNIERAFKPVFDVINAISRLLGGAPRRWMGGPVEGGQQYMVNDGGGREAFLSSSGRFSMLPAGRNLNWTAPSTGVILPAPMAENFRKSMEIQNNIDLKQPEIKPRLSVAASGAMGDSGNLLKQLKASTSQGSTTQRITNNVTIQSQNPVMDASRIMIDMTKAKMRRRPF